jgi:hypothetical protein
MGRPHRLSLGGYSYHVLNRGNGRATVFHKDADYEAFERILAEHGPNPASLPLSNALPDTMNAGK